MVAASRPLLREGGVRDCLVYASVAAERGRVRVQDDAVCAGLPDADLERKERIVRERESIKHSIRNFVTLDGASVELPFFRLVNLFHRSRTKISEGRKVKGQVRANFVHDFMANR